MQKCGFFDAVDLDRAVSSPVLVKKFVYTRGYLMFLFGKIVAYV
jgi:hypothetical protein